MKTPKLKARRMWANYYPEVPPCLHCTKKQAEKMASRIVAHETMPVAVIPLDDVEALENKVAVAIDDKIICGSLTDITRAALVAIGVLPRARKGRK